MSASLIPMNGARVSGREIRRRLNAEQVWLREQLGPAVQQLLNNEQVAKAKITALEERLAADDARTVWQRLRWLVQGQGK